MPTIKALGNISHDGQDYEAGDSLEVTAKQAKALIEAGVAAKGRQAVEGEVVTTPPADDKDGLEDLGFAVLQETATTEGIDIADLKSKDALREAIRSKRAEA